jgi:chromosome segregation ATPase
MSQIQDMIETLAAAKQAMEENPQLKTTVQELTKMLDSLQHDHGALRDHHETVIGERAMLETKLAEKEAELEAARFREQTAMEKLNTVVSTLKGAVNALMPSPDPVADQPEPELVQQSAEVLTEAPAAPINEGPLAIGQIEDIASEMLSQPNSVVNADTIMDEIERMAQAKDTVPSTEPPQPEINVPTVPQPKPYFGKPFSFKPDAVTWPEWVAGGGSRPWWLTNEELAKLSA